MREPRRGLSSWLLAAVITATLVVGWVQREPITKFARTLTQLVFVPETTVVAGGLKQ